MELRFTPAHDRFRDEVREFFDTALTDELRAARRFMTSVYCDHDTGLKWQRILLDEGWLVPSWPIEYGGTNWTMTQRYIFNCERARANPPPVSPMGLAMLGPALLGCGTQAQRDNDLPRMLRGDDFWCQGYFEPQAGSDLAGLQTAAVADGDEAIESLGRSGFVGPENALTVTPFYFNNRAASIYGGSNEIQRNIIAKAVLGL